MKLHQERGQHDGPQHLQFGIDRLLNLMTVTEFNITKQFANQATFANVFFRNRLENVVIRF